MELCVNEKGRIVLRNVTPEAQEYLASERRKVGRNDDNFYWHFSLNYDGTVYVSITPEEHKRELVALLDALTERYGLKAESEAARHLLAAWRREAQEEERNAEGYGSAQALKAEITAVKRVLREGCAACDKFFYDGEMGRCAACVGALVETPLSFRYGKCDAKGTLRLGQKFFPIAGCMYLKEKER